MSLPSNYRFVSVGALLIRNRINSPHYAPNFSIEDLILAIRNRIDRNDIYRSYAKDSKIMWCDICADDDNFCMMIMQVGDKNVTGISLLDAATMMTRDIEKDDNEYGHYAGHIIIKKQPDALGRHLILIEKIPGIYMSSVKDHFTWVCDTAFSQKEVLDDEGRPKRFRAHFEILGRQSRTIRDALRTGRLQDVELVSHQANHADGLDEEPVVSDVVKQIRWEVKKRVSDAQAQSIFEKIRNYLARDAEFDGNRRSFVRIKTDNGQIKQAEIDLAAEEILGQTFIQNEIVTDFDPPLRHRYNDLRQDMIRKLIEIAGRLDN